MYEENITKKLTKNEEMSKKYGLSIYNSANEVAKHQFPYYVEEWGECFSEEEIKENLKDWQMIESLEGGEQ